MSPKFVSGCSTESKICHNC